MLPAAINIADLRVIALNTLQFLPVSNVLDQVGTKRQFERTSSKGIYTLRLLGNMWLLRSFVAAIDMLAEDTESCL